ncbi:MAG TPA: hypothetical protein VMG10_20065 [Gemmataceae bacterium]|nr:hypothetical protein [Gemmataceae bacterium]
MSRRSAAFEPHIRKSAEIEALLRSLGFVGVIPQVLPRINLDEEVEFVDRQGVCSLLWHNPQTRRSSVRAVGTASR